MKVLIADDHSVVRRGVKQILAETPDIYVEGEVADGEELLEKIHQEDWDVVVLDISLPKMGGLDALLELKQKKPQLRVVILTMHAEEQFVLQALKFGASGYVTKESAPEELVDAIRQVGAGGRYISPKLAEKIVFTSLAPDGSPPHLALSDRELQVFRYLARGKSIKEIGETLSLSGKTVTTYRARILEKMNMTNNAELVSYANENQLLD